MICLAGVGIGAWTLLSVSPDVETQLPESPPEPGEESPVPEPQLHPPHKDARRELTRVARQRVLQLDEVLLQMIHHRRRRHYHPNGVQGTVEHVMKFSLD